MSDEVTVRLADDGPGRFRSNGLTWDRGESRPTSAEHADWLVGEYDHFELVDGDSDTCDTVKSDGDVCGRDLPCRYHGGS